MRKVFTKYEEPYKGIIAPYFTELKATPLNDETLVEMGSSHRESVLRPVRKEEGEWGIVFVDYE